VRARNLAVGLAASMSVLGGSVGAAQAAVTPGWECIPITAGQAVVSGGAASAPSCGVGTTPVLAPTYVASGVGGKPTVEFSAVNVQVVNGSGAEATLNGTGNLVVGYDEKPGAQTGSHDLLLGGSNSYLSYGGLVGGIGNAISSSFASVLSGTQNVANSSSTAVLGGYGNHASATYSTIAGGCSNLAGSGTLAVSANCTNTTTYPHGFATVLGGVANQADGTAASASGGDFNIASTACQAIPVAPVNGPC
jgi:hypothetical protein